MKYLAFFVPITTGADYFYLPVPCRGIVKDVWIAHDQESDEDEVWTLLHDTNIVNTVTPSVDAAEGVSTQGERESTYGDYIFDPASETAAHRVIKIRTLSTVDTGGNLGIMIAYDESAAVEQTASEA